MHNWTAPSHSAVVPKLIMVWAPVKIQLRTHWWPHHYEFSKTVKMFGCMNIGSWYVDSLGMSHFTTSASITEYWQGMMSVLGGFLIVICLRTYWCPCHFEFMNYNRVAWWYTHSQFFSRPFEYDPLQVRCFHHWVLARNNVNFGSFPDFYPLNNKLVRTHL